MPTYELLVAYCRTEYLVELPDRQFSIRLGELSSEADSLMRLAGEACWSLITAENPRSQQLSDADNAARRDMLRMCLGQGGWQPFSTTASCPESTWPPESGHLVPGLDCTEALAIAREFDQHAIVYGQVNQPAVLSFTDPIAWEPALRRGVDSPDVRIRTVSQISTQPLF
ncbi:MAG: DUF3293 domain-containing protein [Planctomycetota bacterium]|jgi:hypothetical protein